MKMASKLIHKFYWSSTACNTKIQLVKNHMLFKALPRLYTETGETITTSF